MVLLKRPLLCSVFSVLEYTVVLTNMGYHFTSYWDFYHTHLVLGSAIGYNSQYQS